jgi:5-oxoprolinase (ATP-hydrolysing)
MSNPKKFRFSIDRGGTFTDIYAEIPGPLGYLTMKLLSVDPANYTDAPSEGIRRIIEKVTGRPLKQKNIESHQIEWIRMGTTVATNALLERKGSSAVLVTTKGFKDILKIGYQNRPDIFDLQIKKPHVIYEEIIEIDERVMLLNEGQKSQYPNKEIIGATGEKIEVLKSPDVNNLKKALQGASDRGIRSVAVVLMHAYTFSDHEIMIGKIAQEIGFDQVSLSHQVMPSIRIVGRGDTTVVDAYLTPAIMSYIQSFKEKFHDSLKECKVLFMQSFGGLIDADQFNGSRALLSGPAGGVVGYAITAYNKETKQPVIGFDMGGTSTDVSRYGGKFELTHETETAGVRIQAPQMHIVTVAAGGGSRLFYHNGRFVVGPESTGAHPGPVCYRKGGHLSITDANLVLGRLCPEFFPNIFGPYANKPLDYDSTVRAFHTLCSKINRDAQKRGKKTLSFEEAALGFIKVANETMARPIREISVARGYDIKEHILACFGGAGGQHACALARSLGISRVLIHRFAGILSAFGLGLADVIRDIQTPGAYVYSSTVVKELEESFKELEKQASSELQREGFSHDKIIIQRYLNLRFEGTVTSIMVEEPEDGTYDRRFREIHHHEYGFDMKGRKIIIDDIRIRAQGKTEQIRQMKIEKMESPARPAQFTQTFFIDKWHKTPVYLIHDLKAGHTIQGPALIIQDTATIVLEPYCMASITEYGDIDIKIQKHETTTLSTESDPVQLSIFNNLFMSIAEQMGRTLQRTSLSTNIKERLDFSCALFDPLGNLVANAPHIPVHLGSMGAAVKEQIRIAGSTLKPGDVLVTNDPHDGGTHLPDITVITPVFDKNTIIFFTASRGHHADVGGISPGSIPPFSETLDDEGICIKSFKLVEQGIFKENELRTLLTETKIIKNSKGTHVISGCRNIDDNLSDLKAQVAANKKGVDLLHEIIEHYGLEVVQAYMGHIQDNAKGAVHEMLAEISQRLGLEEIGTVSACDFLDDGSPLCITITIDRQKRTAHFDFTGTGRQLRGNLNAPRSITLSAILYVLRSLVTREIPLNAGCLNPITLTIEEGTFLSPSSDAAVVGGNVETSNRITDCILKALRIASGSQGTMNNFTFGDDRFGYYETIGGGSGAGPSWHGQSGVQTHMTNTRITDPEILERRYPVLLKEFSIRKGSGGKGKYHGGDGLIREIRFLKDMNAAILSERRVFPPYGLEGGQPGQKGRNILIKANGEVIDLGGKNALQVSKGDSIRIETPGGGGYGKE